MGAFSFSSFRDEVLEDSSAVAAAVSALNAIVATQSKRQFCAN